MITSQKLAAKSVHAAVSAIEVYNKPDFHFREEAFSLLMTNAWELLLKAKWLSDHKEKVESLYEQNPDGTYRTNRCKNPITLGILNLASKLLDDSKSGVTSALHHNLCGLVEIRDNAVHFVNEDAGLGQRVMEIGMAAIRNYVTMSHEWFQIDLSRYNFYLMPLSFFHGFENLITASLSPPSEQITRLIDYLKTLDAEEPKDGTGHFVACRLQTQLVRAKDAGEISVRFTNDPSAPAMTVREEDVLKNYPLTYYKLTGNLRRRYDDFKENKKFHTLRKPLEDQRKYSMVRVLQPGNLKSPQTRLYNANIFTEFDKHYTKKAK